MPETPSDDDRFADMFGNLPTPQPRTPDADGESETNAPMSRRAARDARTTGAVPTVEPSSAAPAAGVPAAPVPAAPRAAAPAADATAAPQAAPTASQTTVADEPRPATAALEALFTDSAAERGEKKPIDRDRRKSRIAAWVVFVVVLGMLGGVVAGGLWVWNTYEEPIRDFMGWAEPKDYEDGIAEGEATVTIVSGDTGADISETLFEAGVTKTSDAFYDYLLATGQGTDLLPGVYTLQQQMSSAAAYDALIDPANKLENTVQIPEGYTVTDIVPRIAEALAVPVEEVQAAVATPSDYGVPADSLEGWLFPATYPFDPGTTPAQVIQTMVARTVTSLDSAGVPEERRQEILDIASIIQREARFEADFFKVSRVIQNRLQPNDETNGYLQMDSTAQYGYAQTHPDAEREGTASSREEELADDNPWNTYVHPGLPAGPISNPGDVAIDAAMNPEEGPWLYFVTVNLDTGETVFTETYDEHLRAVDQWGQWCEANPDSGC